jgi:syntaxin 16
MATKNHFPAFKRLRDGYNKQEGIKDLIPGATKDNLPASKRNIPTPYWVETAASVNTAIKEIEENIQKLNEAHKNRLQVWPVESEEEGARDKEIDHLTGLVSRKFKEVEHNVKIIGNATGKKESGGDDEAVRLNVQKNLAAKVQQLYQVFRRTQKQYLSRLKSQKEGGGLHIFDDLENDADTPIKKYEPQEGGLTMKEIQQVRIDLESRDKEIQKIAKSIDELAVLFKELATLVIDQGTILDRIDYNMENVVTSVEAGVEQITKAREIQKQAVPEKCIMMLVCIVLVELVVLIAKHS